MRAVVASSFGPPSAKAFYTVGGTAAPLPAVDELAAYCMEVALECAAAATNCADAFIRRDGSRAAALPCVRSCWNCGDLCLSTARILGKRHERASIVVRAAVEACRTACLITAEACDRHADELLNCTATAKAARRCAAACTRLIERL